MICSPFSLGCVYSYTTGFAVVVLSGIVVAVDKGFVLIYVFGSMDFFIYRFCYVSKWFLSTV